MSDSRPFTASDLLVPFQPRWFATAATDFINETSVLLLVEGVEHVLYFRVSDEPRRTAARIRRERRTLRLTSEDHANSIRLRYAPVPR